MYKDLRDRNSVLSGLIAEAGDTVGVTWNNHAESVQAELVSGNYFETLGVRPAVGRLFGAGDETAPGANPVAVLSFDYWKSHLAEAPVVGKTMLVNGTPFTIIGVAAPGFRSMVWGHTPAVYVPLSMEQVLSPEWKYLGDHKSYWIAVAGRLNRESAVHRQRLHSIPSFVLCAPKSSSSCPISQRKRDRTSWGDIPARGCGSKGIQSDAGQYAGTAHHHFRDGAVSHRHGGCECRRVFCWCGQRRARRKYQYVMRWAPPAGRFCGNCWRRE